MTIAIALKVNDGVILASDSAATMTATDDQGNAVGVVNIYNNANKVFNLYKGLPVGAATWGAGAIGAASTSTLAKDLRKRLMGEDQQWQSWALDKDKYTVEMVAQRMREFMYDEHYVPAFQASAKKPALGFSIAGYSAGEGLAEVYQVLIDENGQCSGPTLVQKKDDTGLVATGAPEPILRLVGGCSPSLAAILQNQLGVPAAQIAPAMQVISQGLQAMMVFPAMPIQDAIDLAEFLVDLTIRFYRFIPGTPIVGGPIEIAAISKHEGFRWVRRKHYFTTDLNPATI